MNEVKGAVAAPTGVKLPEVPDSWQWVTMGQLLKRIEAGKSFKCEERPPHGSEVGVVKVSAVTWGVYNEWESKTITDPARINDAYLIKAGDFLFSRANTIELVGASVIVGATSRRLLLSDKILRFVLPEDMKRWVNWFFKSSFGRSQIEALSTGNQESMRNIGQQRIRQICVPVPPARLMKRVESKLDELFSQIGEGERALERVRKLVERYRRSVLKAAVTGELTRDWRERNKDKLESGEDLLARTLKARREAWEQAELGKMKAKGIKPTNDNWKSKYKEPTSPEVSNLPTLPDGWIWASFEQLIWSSQNGISKRSGTSGHPVRVLRLADISEGRIDERNPRSIFLSKEEVDRYQLARGDLLCVRVNGSRSLTGRLIPFETDSEWSYCDHFIRFQPVPGLVPYRYLDLCFDSGSTRQWVESVMVTTAGQNTVSQGSLFLTPIPLPPLLEQEILLSEVSSRLRQIAQNVSDTDLVHRQSAALRQAVLRAAFAGELAPQATSLLQRIASERRLNQHRRTQARP